MLLSDTALYDDPSLEEIRSTVARTATTFGGRAASVWTDKWDAFSVHEALGQCPSVRRTLSPGTRVTKPCIICITIGTFATNTYRCGFVHQHITLQPRATIVKCHISQVVFNTWRCVCARSVSSKLAFTGRSRYTTVY